MDSTADFAMGYTMGNDHNNGYGYGNGWGNNGMFGMEWIFALLILPMLWGGNGPFGRNGGNPVTEAGLCDAMNFNNLENAVGRLSDTVQAGQRQTDNAICNLGYETLRNFNALERQLADCCCTTQRAIDGVNYNAAMNTAAINANTMAGVQKILDKLCAQENTALRDRIGQLELQQAFCGVPRYLPGTVYGATSCTPFVAGNCGCGCNPCCGNRNI